MSAVPPSRLSRLPTWISHWLGYRTKHQTKLPNYRIWMWSWIASFCGISLIQAVFGQAHYFIERGVPSIVASYGATAVLCYGAIEVPLAQPRALFGGHFLGALTGICITKLFHLLPTEERFQELLWLAGSLSCATAVVVMQITSTTHPPAGATALLAAVNSDIRDMGWYYLPVVLLTSALVFAVGILINNIERRWPVFWFNPPPPPGAAPAPAPAKAQENDTKVGQNGAVSEKPAPYDPVPPDNASEASAEVLGTPPV